MGSLLSAACRDPESIACGSDNLVVDESRDVAASGAAWREVVLTGSLPDLLVSDVDVADVDTLLFKLSLPEVRYDRALLDELGLLASSACSRDLKTGSGILVLAVGSLLSRPVKCLLVSAPVSTTCSVGMEQDFTWKKSPGTHFLLGRPKITAGDKTVVGNFALGLFRRPKR